MVSSKILGLLFSAALAVQAYPQCGCAADDCFAKASLPAAFQPTLTAFCYNYLGSAAATETVTATATQSSAITSTVTGTDTTTAGVTETVTETVTITPTADPATITETETTVVGSVTTVATPCDTTTTTTISTSYYRVVDYASRSSSVAADKRSAAPEAPAVPTELSRGCKANSLPAKLSSACSCVLATATSPTVTVTSTATVINTDVATFTETVTVTTTGAATTIATNTAPTANPTTVTTITTSTSLSTVETCFSTATVVVTSTTTTDFTCGTPSPTVLGIGYVTCPDPADPEETGVLSRIEGSDSEGTIFEGCVNVRAGDLTTPSGGTHKCDGTNNGANPVPGGTSTRALAASAALDGFDFDGTWDNSFDDFFITRISSTAQTSSQFWGLLINDQFSPVGGCQAQLAQGDRNLWAYDSFNKANFLQVTPGYSIVRAGSAPSQQVQVIDAPTGRPVSGASIAGTITDANGMAEISVPARPGCYQYKATRADSLRSNAFYLTVMPAED
ncbi:hypothetical protein MN608_11272 [Microdochium nivale]|nr:hypothetical protein MN608_11272 [Microdochium nivale]